VFGGAYYFQFYFLKQAGSVVFVNRILTHERQLHCYVVIIRFNTECFKKIVYSLAYVLA